MPMCKDFFVLAREPGEFNEQFFTRYWQSVYQNQNGLILVNDSITAMLGVVSGYEMTTGNKYVAECFMYGNGALRLVKEMEDIAEQCGAKIIYLHNIEFLESKRLEKVYSRKGYHLKFNRHMKVL